VAEPDGELVDLEPAPFGGEEVAEFVDDDEDVEEQDDFRKRDQRENERDEAVHDPKRDKEADQKANKAEEAEVGPDGSRFGWLRWSGFAGRG
jgi:hypothetical protein